MTYTKILAAFGLIALISAPISAFAEDGPGPGGRHGRFMEQADINKDGFLTKDELRAANEKRMDEMFTNVDTDKDGKLSKDEQRQGREAYRAKMQERFKQHKETNNDK